MYLNSWIRRSSLCALNTPNLSAPTLKIHFPLLRSSSSFKTYRLLIIGFGDIAHRLAGYLNSSIRIFAYSRTSPHLSNVRWKNIDLDQRSHRKLSCHGFSGMVYLAPPPSAGKTDSRIMHLLTGFHVKHAVYVSTTGVYGDHAGAWIDETQPVNPYTPRAQRRVHAERSFRRWGTSYARHAMILRTPGIYAADRLPMARLKAKTPALNEHEDVYSNHIHADDLARLCWITLFRGRSQRTYNACDFTSMKMGEYFDAVAQAFKLPLPPRVSRQELANQVSAMQLSFMEESRRIKNERIQKELRFVFRYPYLESWLLKAAAQQAETS